MIKRLNRVIEKKVIDLIWRSSTPYQLDPFDYMLEPFCLVPWNQMFSRITKECWTRERNSQAYRKNAKLVNADVAEVQIMPEDDSDGLKEDIVASKSPAGNDLSMKS